MIHPTTMKLRLREILSAKGMKQVTLAERVGVEKGYVSELVAGKKVPSLATLEKIADALDVSIIELIADDHSALERDLVERYRSLSDAQQQALLQFLDAMQPSEEPSLHGTDRSTS